MFDGQCPDVRDKRTNDAIGDDSVMTGRTPVNRLSSDDEQSPLDEEHLAIPTTLAERVKEAAKAQGLSITQLAQALGASRPAFSTRLHAGSIDEEELVRIAALVKRTPAWLRYGVQGDFRDGARWAVRQMMDRLRDLEGTEPMPEAPPSAPDATPKRAKPTLPEHGYKSPGPQPEKKRQQQPRGRQRGA